MAEVRFTLEEASARAATMDRPRLDATTEADIRRYQVEDGFDPDAIGGPWRVVLPPHTIREELGMTQEEFAAFLRVPLSTLQAWEQGRALPDPVARSLLDIVAREPEAARRALAG